MKGLKFLLAVTLINIFLNILSVCEVDAQERVKIGVSTALSGDAATYGLDIKDALIFANEKLADNRYQLVFEDDRCDPKTAVGVANKLINADNVKYVLGFACSGTVLATAPIYERAKRVVITTCASSPKIADAGEYIFRTTPSDIVAARQLYQHISASRKHVVILSEESDYAQDLEQAFVAAADSDSKMKIVRETFLPATSDFKTQLTRIRNTNPDSLFLNTQTERSFVVLLRQINEMSWSVPIYGAYWPGSPALLSEAGELANGIEFVDTPSLSGMLSPQGAKVFEEFLVKYPRPRSIESIFASSFEAFRAIDQAHRSKRDVRDYLLSTKFDGIFGPFEFDSKGEILGISFALKRIVDGKAITLK